MRGKLRLAEGHVDLSAPRWTLVAMHDAEEKFDEAQQLMPKSPDPQLGLAYLYAYGLKDIDKADAALQQAERHGYRSGNREKNMLADGYRQRANLKVCSAKRFWPWPKPVKTNMCSSRWCPIFFEILTSCVHPENIGGIHLLGVDCLPLNGYRNGFVKRIAT